MRAILWFLGDFWFILKIETDSPTRTNRAMLDMENMDGGGANEYEWAKIVLAIVVVVCLIVVFVFAVRDASASKESVFAKYSLELRNNERLKNEIDTAEARVVVFKQTIEQQKAQIQDLQTRLKNCGTKN